MADGFELARGLMQLSSLTEQRKARKEELRFKKAYEAPFREALTNLYNAQATRMADRELTGLQEEQKRETGLKADRLQLVLDEIDKLKKRDPDNPLISQAIFGIRDTQDMSNEIAMMRARMQEQTLMLRQSEVMMGQSERRQKILFEDSAEGAATRAFLNEKGVLNDLQVEALEGTFDLTLPGDVEKKGFDIFEKIKSLLDAAPQGTTFPPSTRVAPSEPSRGKLPSTAKPKPAPKKAPEKKGEAAVTFTTDETAAIYEKARENDVNPLDIAAGVQKLIETFPDLDRATLLEAHNLLAEGHPVEDIRKHIEERIEK